MDWRSEAQDQDPACSEELPAAEALLAKVTADNVLALWPQVLLLKSMPLKVLLLKEMLARPGVTTTAMKDKAISAWIWINRDWVNQVIDAEVKHGHSRPR